jgi:hemerythrin superfamily protein
MVEHASLRLQFRFARETNYNTIYELEEFVRTCHAKIEDELVFPKFRETLTRSQKENVVNDLSRLEADHKLIDKIGDQIKSKTIEGDERTLQKRIMLYLNTVETHNSAEENLIFPHWNISGDEERSIKLNALKVIENFGVERYFEVTGFSQKLFDIM